MASSLYFLLIVKGVNKIGIIERINKLEVNIGARINYGHKELGF